MVKQIALFSDITPLQKYFGRFLNYYTFTKIKKKNSSENVIKYFCKGVISEENAICPTIL